MWVAELLMTVGVPGIAPVDESSETLRGRRELTTRLWHRLTVGVTVVMAVPLVKVNEFGLHVSDEGSDVVDDNGAVAVSLPPVLEAVTV